MKHTKTIAWIVTFALLAVTMIGTLTGCLSTSTGSSTETPAVVKPEPSGVYVDAPYPEEGTDEFYIVLADFQSIPGKVQCYFITKNEYTYGSVLFNELFTEPVAYELSGNTIVFKNVVLTEKEKEKESPRDYTGTYDGATDTIDIPNEFPGRFPGGFTTVSFTSEDYFKLETAFIPLSDKSFVNGPFDHVNGAKACWFMEHDTVNKTMQLYFVRKEQNESEPYIYPKFGKMENGKWVASPASYEDTGDGTLLFKNVWVVENDAPVDFEITYGKYEGITLPNINAGFGGGELFLEATDKNYLDPTVSWE